MSFKNVILNFSSIFFLFAKNFYFSYLELVKFNGTIEKWPDASSSSSSFRNFSSKVFCLNTLRDYLWVYLKIFEAFNLLELEQSLRVSRDVFFDHRPLLTEFLLKQEIALLLCGNKDLCYLDVKIFLEGLC